MRSAATSRPAPRLVVLGAVLVLALMWFVPVLGRAPGFSPGQDLAWYRWRTELLTGHEPSALVGWDGPLGVFGGAYRVTTPILGGVLEDVAGLSDATVSELLVAGRLVLLALLCGAIVHRFTRSAWAFAVTTLFAGGSFFLTPYVGYVDNGMAMLFCGTALLLLDDARVRWAARVAVASLVFVSFFTHPPTALLFSGAVLAAFVIRLAARRPSGKAVREEGPLALTVAVAAAVATVSWAVGLWGPGAAFSDATHPPPLSPGRFLVTVTQWIGQFQPLRLVPLVVVGVALSARPWRRTVREASRRVTLLWLLPLIGVLGSFTGLRYPFHRFLNSTPALLVLGGIGAWGLASLLRGTAARRGWPVAGALLAVGLVGLILVTAWRDGRQVFDRRGPWLTRELVASLDATRAYLSRDRDDPVVFVIAGKPWEPDDVIWGGFKGWTNRLLAAVPGERLSDTYVFVGGIPDLVIGRPSRTGNPLLDRISQATHRELREGLGARAPLVVLVRDANLSLENLAFIRPAHSVMADDDVAILSGSGFAEPDAAALPAARQAGDRVRAGDNAARRSIVHVARVTLGLALVLLVPGLLLARWLGVRGLPALLGTVPALSLSIEALAGLGVLTLLGRPLSPGVGWLVVGVACAVSAGLAFGRPNLLSPGHGGQAQKADDRKG